MNYLTFPALTEVAANRPQHVGIGFAGGKSGPLRTIAVVSNNSSERDLWRALLSPMDCCVLTAKDGKEALRIIEEHRVDLVIAAIVMPRMDGVELSRTLGERLPKTELILIAKGCEEADRIYLKAGELYGAAATYTQPLDTEDLLARVRAVLGFDAHLRSDV